MHVHLVEKYPNGTLEADLRRNLIAENSSKLIDARIKHVYLRNGSPVVIVCHPGHEIIVHSIPAIGIYR